MIVYIEGILKESHPLHVVILAGGIGYGVHVPLRVAEELPTPGSQIQLYTRQVIREDASELFGFTQSRERDFFDMITKVSGIGPRTALTLLSRVSPDTLQSAISNGDTALLSQCPGIGKKTAERLVVELRDKLSTFSPSSSAASTSSISPGEGSTAPGARAEAVAALVTLGFKFPDAEKAVEKVIRSSNNVLSTEELVRSALKTK